jgi:hypothetical protein
MFASVPLAKDYWDGCSVNRRTGVMGKLVPDEATRDTSGSPNIALKILEKIDEASIFIADITMITAPGSLRPCLTPNASYELGYAVATLGWERVILLFNKAVGNFPADLAFDFIQNRASPYSYSETDPSTKQDELRKFLEIAAKAVLDKNPKRPAELKGLSREKIEHDHDMKNMRWLMRSLHLPMLQDHINDLPHIISDKALRFFENFHGVVANSLFSVYDTVLADAVDKLFLGWRDALAHDNQYRDTPSGTAHAFYNPSDTILSAQSQKAWDKIDAGRRQMAEAQAVILDRPRAEYIEIDIHKTNPERWRDYLEFKKDVELSISPKRKSKSKRKKK